MRIMALNLQNQHFQSSSKKLEETYKNEEFVKKALEYAKKDDSSKPIEKAKKVRKAKVEKKAVPIGESWGNEIK